MNEVNKAYLRLHLAVLLAGGTGIFGRLISLSELPLVWFRVLIAAVTMLLVMAASRTLRKVSLGELWQISGCGIMLAVHWVCFYASIKFANVSIGVVCIALDGFFTALIEPLFNRHRPLDRSFWVGVLLIIMSVVLQTIYSKRASKRKKAMTSQ